MEYRDRNAEDHLVEFFGEAAGVAGLKSIHGALVDMAQSGASGTRSPRAPEDQWYDRRRFAVRFHAQTKRALERIGANAVNTLWAYYGSPGWPGPAPNTLDVDAGADERDRKRRWHRTRPPPEVVAELGAGLARVALMTSALVEAEEAWLADGHAAKRGGPLLVALCASRNRADAGDPVSVIEAEAQRLHAAALAAFCLAAGLSAPRQRKTARRPPGARWEAPAPRPVRGVRP